MLASAWRFRAALRLCGRARAAPRSHRMLSSTAELHAAARAETVELHRDAIVVTCGGKPLRFNYVWLRDHCPASYNKSTFQREVDTATIDLSIYPESASVKDGNVLITWPGGHVSKYSIQWLAENSYEAAKKSNVQPRILWNSDIYKKAKIPSAKWDTFMSSDDELKTFLQNYLHYGIAIVDGVPASVEATEEVVQRVSLVRETTYGKMWCLTSDQSRGDTAYTQIGLDRHTDTSYFHEPCGIQVFHCLKHDGTGGRTLLVDGFYAAEIIREQSPENFELLSRVTLRHEYVEKTGPHRNHMVGIGPVFSVYPWNHELYQLRYNNYDRSVMNTVPHNLVQRWYVAHRELTAILRRPENELWLKLTPGKVIFIDNWRVLHGREAFTGLRQLCGCYLTRDDVLSTARCLGLQA